MLTGRDYIYIVTSALARTSCAERNVRPSGTFVRKVLVQLCAGMSGGGLKGNRHMATGGV